MENNKFNPEVAKELYNEAASIGKTSIPEEDFYQNLGDSEYARMVYRRYKDKYGVNLLGAEDDSSFLGSLGYTTDYVGNKPVEKKETTPKQEKPVRIPNIRTVKDDDTGEDVYVDIDIPKTPDMTLKLPNSMDRFKQNPLEDNLVKKVFGVESLADAKNPQERLQEQIAQLGKDKEEVRYDDEGNPFTVKIADSHKDLDIERIKNIRESIAQQQAYDRKINDEFVKKYELLKSKLTAEENYSPKESWAPRNLKPKNITEEDKEFLRIYADKYNKIKEARKALDNQSKFAKSYAQLAEYDASVEKGEQMSAMVAKGEISEDDMDILRSSKSQAASQQYIERQVKNGRISRVTANKLYEMGDLTERDAFSYGFTKTGNLEDLITFGITEIVRNFDVAAIANKVKNGQKLTDEEANVISMYGKMSDMLSEAKQDARGWQFTAGQGMQKTLLFIAEMGMTGGVSGLGKTFGKEAAKALVRKYGLKKASGIIAKQTGKRLAQSAKQQLFLTPLTPAAYVDYSDRVLKMTLDKPEVTTKDKIAALYKSYAQIWAERFSESLGDIVVDVPVGGLLSKTSFYKKAIEPVANIFNKITELPGYKNTSKTLRQFGVDNMPVEIFEETINPFLYSVATAFTDTKEIEQIDGDFFRQVALTSAILGGFHGALGYTVGASTAAIESKRIDNAYSDIMSKISKMKFLNKNMESLREELVVALNRQNYIESESGNKGRTVGQILGDMNAEMQSFAESDRNLATYKYDRRVFEAMDYASRVGAYKYGSNLGIKGEVSARLGRAKDEDGNIIPMDFEHKDGNVYEASVNGQNYFILDESNDAVVVVNRETGEKEILNKNVFDTSTITQTNANDWAMNTYLLNFNNWKAQDSQTQNQQTQQGQPTTPPTHVVLRGEQLPIKNIDPETGDVTITDNTGDELTIPANDPEIELVYPTQQEEAPVQQEETPQPVAEENAPIEEPVAPTEEQVNVEMQEPEYVAPRSEDNDIVWNEVPAERFKQVIDEEVGADYADGYIDMRIEDAQRKLNEHNEKQKPIASGEYKAFMEESKKLESDLAYWTNAKQEYANAVAQEVAAQNEVETLLQDEANEVAPESTVMYDAKQQEQVEAEAPVQVSKEELDSTVAGWKTNGVNVNVVNSIDEITNEQVLADINKGVKVTGWYDTKTGEVYVFAPNITDTSELDSTVIHEVVAHKGLRGLVGEKYYQQFCEKVFSSMSKELQDKYLTYHGVNGNKAAAADEYIAYLAEKEDLTAEEQSIWDKIIQFFREYFDARLVGILKKDKITDADIAQLIRMSYANIKNNAKQDETTEDTAKQELNEEGFETDNTGTVRFSVKYVPDESLREKIISNLMAVTGDTREKVEKWLESELSLANIINDEMNRDVLDYEADDRYGAIKKNSDYPQGTVDFNNICRKRLDFTNIYKQLQSAYPNRIFTAEDLEAIRQTMIEDGLMVACGLCYVEDRRQLLGEIANDFIENLKNGTLKENIAELLDPEDTYIPTIADLLAPEGSKEFYNEHPALYNAFVKFNNARGQQAGRLFEGYAEYKREILKWNDKKVKSVNNVGGLRIFSFSDFEAHHLIDIVQIVIDAASKGVMIQGYTKVPTFARAMRNTGIKINRSLIPEGNGIKEVDGQLQLAFDPVEGIDVNDKDFLDEESNPNIGNVLVGINEEQIRMAMTDAFVDYIIPFHSGIRKDILDKKKIGHWVNYKNSQREKDLSTGKSAENGINIYTDVLQAAEAEGKPIKTKKQFVNKFLAVCKERGLEPRFSQFLDKDAKGNYVYTEGYHKFLVDFKLFDKKGKILPQQPVVPVFDNTFNAEILNNYVEDTKTTKEYGETVEKIKERLGLENNPTDPNDGPRYRVPNDVVEGENAIAYRTVTDQEVIKALESSPKKTGYRNVVLNLDGTFGSPMASGLRSKGKDKVRTTSFEIGKWEQAEENPQLANEEGKITLVKPDGKSVADVDYNPYIHNRLDTVNAQFKQAWERPNLVYIETEVATTDLESGYKAEKAAKPVGVHKWNNGDLMLSRYDKPIRIVPWSEVADDWVERFKDRGVEFDIVPPALLPILTMRGVNILPPHKGMGKSCNDAYAEWQKNPLKKKEGIITDEQIEQLNKQYGVNTQENQEQTAQADTKENDDIRYRIPSTPAEARQRAENIMKDAISPMATELGVEVNYVTSDDISDVEPGARKKRQSKGWYQDGKVYINLSTHETIDDARETYLHEVVAHYGLRGLLKDQFEPVMQKVFASLTPTQQQSLLEIFADEVEAAEEFLASMAENDTDPDIVDKVIGFIRDALRSMGINLDNYTNSDLMYLLWRSKNNLKENAGHIETARWEAKDTEVRYRTFKNGRLSANSQYGTVDRLIEKAKDTVWSVKLLQDEIVARGGFITDTSDPYGQSTLMPQRSAYEIDDFNKRHYKPMLKTFSKAAKMLAKRKGISVYDANDAIEDFLYARHAIERNRKLAIDKMYAKATGMFADLTKEQREQLKEIAEALYDANYSSSPVVVEVVPYPNSNKLALSINGLYKDSHFSIDEFDTIKTAIDEWTAENPEVNESGLTDKQAQDIIDDVYVNQSAQMQDMLDEVSTSIKDCTKFILDKWLEYGMISNSDYNKYLNQYDYYIPLRGWDETSDIEYEDVAGNEYNKGETLISLNRQARGRKSKADSPLAFIAQMATSAIVYGNKNRLKQMAFNMIRHNYDLIQDLVFIEDDDKLTHKTKSEIKAHEVQLKNNGRTVRFSFQKNFGVGVAAATAIKGDNVQNITNPIMRAVGGATRLQSRLRTSLNPVFMVVNGVRDYFFGNLSYFIKYGIGDTIELNKNYVKGFACAFLDAAGKPLGNSPLRQMYEEYKREGGQTGYIHLDDIKRLKRETRKIQRRYQNGWNRVSSSVLKLPSYILRLLGEPGENAMRFAAYKTLRDKGVSSRQAAKAAKEITVNFNRTGTSKWPGMLWGFYNATLEGTANYFRMGFNKETAARFWMTNAALAAVSYVMAGWAKGFGDDDDDILEGMTDEERAEYLQQKEFANEYNRISNYVKRTNILIPMMGDDSEEKKFIAIPLPQSFRMASALGITLRDIIENNKNALDELEELAWFAIGEVQPFDIENISIEKGDGFLSNLERVASPSIVLPWLEVEQNRNFMGNPIYKESYVNESYNDRIEPSYTIAGNQTPEFLIATAKEINEKLGGTEYMAAKENEKIAQNRQDARGLQYTLALMADAADPASVDHILKGTLGGFYELGVKAIDRYNSEEENIAEDWILADRFIKSATRKPGAERYYERKKYADELERLMKNEKKNAKKGEANQYLNSPHHQELVKVNKYWKKRIKDITDKISMYKKGNVVNEEKITELKEQRDALVLEAALAFERLERKYKEQE